MHHKSPAFLSRAFTLVEVLIVVVILGILAAVVVPQFTNATEDTKKAAIADQTKKIRQAIAMFYVRNGNRYPNITAGSGNAAWGYLIGPGYFKQAPANAWVGGPNADVVVIGNGPDTAHQTTHGWIWDPATGNLWAGSCDANDVPYAVP